MLISRTPFRISFVGGGSDLESYYKHKGGSVLSTSIDKFIYQSSHKYFYKNKCLIKYSKTENIDDIEKINHPIIKNIFKRFGINNVDYNSIADIPSGTGMGSSSSFTVGLIKLYSEYKNINMTKREIAELACAVEIDDLKEPIGKQDQYAAAFGGINEIVFNENLIKTAKKFLKAEPFLGYVAVRCHFKNNLPAIDFNLSMSEVLLTKSCSNNSEACSDFLTFLSL